jgi:hypothetical protein
MVKESMKLWRNVPAASQNSQKTVPTGKEDYEKAPDDTVLHEKP